MTDRTAIDFTQFTVDDVITCLTRAGYIPSKREFADASNDPESAMKLVDRSPKPPKVVIVVLDLESSPQEPEYLVVELYLSLSNSGIVADYGGVPVHQSLTYDQACEKLQAY